MLVRYIINGVIATTIHYVIFLFLYNVVEIGSAGLANFIAAIFGVMASFLGNRYFVFKSVEQKIVGQAILFYVLYGVIAVAHGLTMYFWVDILKFNQHVGFLLASIIQFAASFFGNKVLVFKK